MKREILPMAIIFALVVIAVVVAGTSQISGSAISKASDMAVSPIAGLIVLIVFLAASALVIKMFLYEGKYYS